VKSIRVALKQFGVRPSYVHVMPPVAFPAWFRLRQGTDTQATAAHTALRRVADKVGVKADCQLLFGDPADELAAAAASARSGLVILKLRKGPRFTGPRRGSITYRLAAGGTTAVLAVP
jgi:hypothetical protein